MRRRPPRYTLTYTLFPYTTRVRSDRGGECELVGQRVVGRVDRLRAHTPFSLVHRLADLADIPLVVELARGEHVVEVALATGLEAGPVAPLVRVAHARVEGLPLLQRLLLGLRAHPRQVLDAQLQRVAERSEEHTSELQSLMRTSYAVFCLK